MKINRVEIFNRAWHLIKTYNMSKSEALRMSWAKAIKGERLAELNKELFLLNMRDLSGGKNNIMARIQIEENNAAIDRVTREINELNRAIYPTKTVSTTYDNLKAEERTALIKRIANLETEIENIKSGKSAERPLSKNEEILLKLGVLKTAPKPQDNTVELARYEEMLRKAKYELENSVRTYTSTVLDLNAYDEVTAEINSLRAKIA